MATLKNHGLNNWAKDRLDEAVTVREVGVRILPSGARENFDRQVEVPAASREARECTQIAGKFPLCLQTYRLPDGTELHEFVQHTVTYCDANAFLALRRADNEQTVTESLWQDHEIAALSACYCRHTC